jgi:hypothetical protein
MPSKERKKRTKGEPVHWDELKKTRTLTITDTAWSELKKRGDDMGGISRSEVIEIWMRTEPQISQNQPYSPCSMR